MHPAETPGLAADAVAETAALSRAELNRLRWRCRRGMLENDLVLTRFLDQRGPSLTEAEVDALDRLLELPDDLLWDLVSGRKEPDDTAVQPVIAMLRNA